MLIAGLRVSWVFKTITDNTDNTAKLPKWTLKPLFCKTERLGLSQGGGCLKVQVLQDLIFMEKYFLGLWCSWTAPYTYGNIQQNIIIDGCASAGGVWGGVRGRWEWPLCPSSLSARLQHHAGNKSQRNSGKEIPQGTAVTAFGWLVMFQKSFLIIQSLREGGYRADVSSPLVHSEAPSLISSLPLFTLVSTQAAAPQGDTIIITASVRHGDVCL